MTHIIPKHAWRSYRRTEHAITHTHKHGGFKTVCELCMQTYTQCQLISPRQPRSLSPSLVFYEGKLKPAASSFIRHQFVLYIPARSRFLLSSMKPYLYQTFPQELHANTDTAGYRDIRGVLEDVKPAKRGVFYLERDPLSARTWTPHKSF